MACCEENWEIAPFGHKHAWASGDQGQPTGNCLRCGKSYIDYSKQMINKIIEAHDIEMKEIEAEERKRLDEKAN
jgi:hypothetical protein